MLDLVEYERSWYGNAAARRQRCKANGPRHAVSAIAESCHLLASRCPPVITAARRSLLRNRRSVCPASEPRLSPSSVR